MLVSRRLVELQVDPLYHPRFNHFVGYGEGASFRKAMMLRSTKLLRFALLLFQHFADGLHDCLLVHRTVVN